MNPLALKLALRDTTPSAYLARPCQYVGTKYHHNCSRKYWTSYRFALEVIQSSSQAIDQLKKKFGATKLILVGYSGGGAVAALIAAQRQDVLKLITVAGNLASRTWVAASSVTAVWIARPRGCMATIATYSANAFRGWEGLCCWRVDCPCLCCKISGTIRTGNHCHS